MRIDWFSMMVPGAFALGLTIFVVEKCTQAEPKPRAVTVSVDRQAAAVCREFIPRFALPDRPNEWIDYLGWRVEQQPDLTYRVLARYTAYGPWSGTRDRMVHCYVSKDIEGNWRFVKIQRLF